MPNLVKEKPPENLSNDVDADSKNIFMRDIEITAIKEALLTEIDISSLKESLLEDVKATLLKEIDMSAMKEALTKEIVIKDLVSSSAENAVASSINQSATTISSAAEKIDLPAYKYGLVDSLMNEHEEIISLHEIIVHSVEEQDYEIIPLLLSNFAKKCIDHFHEEEELYQYMRAYAASRSEIEKKVANDFSNEMKNLSVSVTSILNQGNYVPVTSENVEGFRVEFEQIKQFITERSEREEKILYPIYENSKKVVDIC